MKFPFFWQRNDKSLEFKQGLALTESEKNDQSNPELEAMKAMHRQQLMLGDERLSNFLDANPAFHAFIPALASVNRTTKHISKVDARVAWLDFQILFALEEMAMPPEVYEAGGLEIMQGLEIYAATQISDGYEGWKGRILTEQRKSSSVELKK